MRDFLQICNTAWISVMLGLVGGAVCLSAEAVRDELRGIREELHSARVAPEQTCEVGDE